MFERLQQLINNEFEKTLFEEALKCIYSGLFVWMLGPDIMEAQLADMSNYILIIE